MNVMWNMENVRLVIEADGVEPYDISSDTSIYSDNRRFIENSSADAAENNSSNPFGLCGSRGYNFTIVDIDDYLSPTNTESPYYNKIKNGSKVLVYIEDTEAEDEEHRWKPDGTYYITNISGSFNNGMYQSISLSCRDKLDNIGSKNNPKIPCYRNIKVEDFLNIIFSSIGLVKDLDWKINSSIGSKVLVYGITVGDKIRETLNALAQYLQVRMVMDRSNVLRIEYATGTYGNDYELPYDLVSSLNNIYVSSTNYKDVVVNYNVDGYKVEDILLNDNSYQLKAGDNLIEDIKFNTKALSIRHITIQFDKYLFDSSIEQKIYHGYQDGLTDLFVHVEGQDITNCTLYAEGMSIEKSTRSKTAKIMNDENSNGTSITLDIKYVISEAEASSLLSSVKDTIEKSSRIIVIETIASPFLDIGAKVILKDEEYTPTYKGEYKLLKYQRKDGINYKNKLTLMRL